MPEVADSDRLMLFSADCHAGPALRTFKQYMDPNYLDDFIAYVRAAEGFDAEVQEMFAQDAGETFEVVQEFSDRDSVAGLYDPAVLLEHLEADGVVGGVIFPQGAVPFAPYPPQPQMAPPIIPRTTPEMQAAGCRAYNRWLTDFCASNPARLAGVGVMPIRDVDAAVREIEWMHSAGLRGVSLPPISEDFAYFNDVRYEPIWATCERLDLPLNTHGASVRFYGNGPDALPLALAEVDFFSRRSLWFLIFSGVFERYPKLKMVFTEQRAGWVLPTLSYLDDIARSPLSGVGKYLPRLPSEYFATNCFIGASFMSAAEAGVRHEIGVEKLMWGSDYPHPEGAWPWSRESLRLACSDVPDAELRLMLGVNAARCYGMDLSQLDRAAAKVGPTIAELREPLVAVPAAAQFSWGFRASDKWT